MDRDTILGIYFGLGILLIIYIYCNRTKEPIINLGDPKYKNGDFVLYSNLKHHKSIQQDKTKYLNGE